MDHLQSSPEQNNGSQNSSELKRLTEAKLERKKMEEDAKLLANRIALLESEEKKAQKKILETKKKAEDISNVKKRNKEMMEAKQTVRIVFYDIGLI